MKTISLLFGIPEDQFEAADAWQLMFQGVPENLWYILAGIVLVVLLVLFIWKYNLKEGLKNNRTRYSLVLLRLAVILLLALIAMQPAIGLKYNKYENSELAVLLDDTRSMQWRDRYAEQTIEQLANGLQVDKNDFSGEKPPARYELLRLALLKQQPLWQRLSQNHRLSFHAFGSADLDERQYLTKALNNDHLTLENMERMLSNLRHVGPSTHLGRAFYALAEYYAGRNLKHVLLFSDGRNTQELADERTAAVVEQLRSAGVDVYVVPLGDPANPKNLKLEYLRAPEEVRKENHIQLVAQIGNSGYDRFKAEVALYRRETKQERWELIEKKNLDYHSADPLQQNLTVNYEAEAKETGLLEFKVEISPLNDEVLTRDNQAQATVKVSDRQIKVLLVSGSGSWEFQYLRNYLLRQPELYRVTCLQQNADASFNQDASTGIARSMVPATRNELFEYDVVVLYDPSYGNLGFDEHFAELLEAFVAEHHGGLCYIAGRKYTNENLRTGSPLHRLAELLPVIVRRAQAGDGYHLQGRRTLWPARLTERGETHPVLKLAEQSEQNERIWNSLSGFYSSHPVARVKTLATVLIESTDATLQLENGLPCPLLAIQYYGKGRVAFTGTDATWRWRSMDDAQHYRKYWANLIGFLGAGRMDKKRVLVATDSERYELGSGIRIHVEAFDRDYKPLAADRFFIRALDSNSGRYSEPVTLSRVGEGIFEGTMLAGNEGTFELLPYDETDHSSWNAEEISCKRISIVFPEREFARPAMDRLMLERIAGSQDKLVPLYRLDTLDEMIKPAPALEISNVVHGLWNTHFVLGLIGLLLLCEWTLRKLNHLM